TGCYRVVKPGYSANKIWAAEAFVITLTIVCNSGGIDSALSGIGGSESPRTSVQPTGTASLLEPRTAMRVLPRGQLVGLQKGRPAVSTLLAVAAITPAYLTSTA